jgi:hypothetical protein
VPPRDQESCDTRHCQLATALADIKHLDWLLKLNLATLVVGLVKIFLGGN